MGSDWKALYCKASHQLPWWLWDKHTMPLHGRDEFLDGFQTLMCHREHSLPSSERIAVGAHPPCWRIKTQGYFWSSRKANPTLEAEAAMSDHSAPHLWVSVTFLSQKATPQPLALGNRCEAWDTSLIYPIFSLEMHSAALDWDFPAKKSLLITQSSPLDTTELHLP